MTIHLVGLPHTAFDDSQFSHCAFTSKAVRLVEMLRSQGERVEVYWGGGLDLPIEETVAFPWDGNHPVWETFHEWAIDSIRSKLSSGDIIAIVGGCSSQAVVDAFPEHIVCEPMVGYEGIARGTHLAFESYAWMHHRYGATGINDGRAFDTVIPPFQRADDFQIGRDEGYALYLGRHILRKGVRAASDIAKAAGLPLYTAGAGASQSGSDVQCDDGTVIPDATYLGPLGPVDRRKVLSGASVLICPTLYIEPGGNVAIEAMLSGVWPVAPDYGVFTETVPEWCRYSTLAEARDAVKVARQGRGQWPRQVALGHYSMEAAAPRFKEWLDRLRLLRGQGWYSLP